jgi:hypothetical protein
MKTYYALCLTKEEEERLGMVPDGSVFYYSEDKDHIKEKENELSKLPLLIRALQSNKFRIACMEKPAHIELNRIYEEGCTNAS